MFPNMMTMMKLEASIFLNGVLYFLKKIPLVKKLFVSASYGFISMKRVLGYVSFVYQLLFSSLKSILLALVFLLLPMVFLGQGDPGRKPLTLVLFFYGLTRLFMPTLLELNKSKFILLKELKMEPVGYAKAFLLKKEGFKFLGRTLGFLLLTGVVMKSPLEALYISLLITGLGLGTEALHLFLYKKKRFLLEEHSIFLIFLYLLLFGGGAALFYYGPSFDGGRILLHPVTGILVALVTFISIAYIRSYDYYMEALLAVTSYEKMEKMNNAMAEARVADVKLRESDYNLEEEKGKKSSEKEGYAYLHELFIRRHGRFFRKPIYVKSALVVGVFVILGFVKVFFEEDLFNTMATELTGSYTLFIFLMYMLSNSQRDTKAMFYNCDLFLLRYGFYREPKALLTMFFLRLRRIVFQNLLPTALIILGLGIFIALSDQKDFLSIMPLAALILTLSLMFSVHYLFMYYIFQPYTSSMEVKSPAFSIINGLVYFASYMALQIKAPARSFLPVLIAIGLLYTALAVLFVYKKAPKTFRVK